MRAALVQARMGSTRLPGKVLADVAGQPMIERVLKRVQSVRGLDRVVLVTTQDSTDNLLVERVAQLRGIDIFRGSTEDVLDRYHQAALFYRVKVIVRITGDCPLVDPALIDHALSVFLKGNFDFVSTAYPVPSFPDGLDVEIFPSDVLEEAWRQARLPSEREHVTPYIWKSPQRFRLKSLVHSQNLSALRWTVDEEADLQFVRQVVHLLEKKGLQMFGMNDVLDLLKSHPELSEINRGIRRNEGYEKSLKIYREIL